MKRFAIAAALVLALGLGASAQEKKEEAKKAPPPPPELKLKVGDMAPDFTLLDTAGKPVSLHDYRGKKNVALGFYIFAFTGG